MTWKKSARTADVQAGTGGHHEEPPSDRIDPNTAHIVPGENPLYLCPVGAVVAADEEPPGHRERPNPLPESAIENCRVARVHFDGGRKKQIFGVGLARRGPAGKVDKTSVLGAVDCLPTICSIAGVKTPDIKPDGEDISDILRGKSRARRRPLFWEWRAGVAGNQAYKPPALAIRDGNWKLYANPNGSRQELYNIPKDPEERTNLAAKNPEVAARLLAKLLEWKRTLPK